MMKSYLTTAFFLTCFFSCVFATSIPVPPRADQVEILLAFKSEFPSSNCDHIWSRPNFVPYFYWGTLSSWTKDKDARSYSGVGYDDETGIVTKLDLQSTCISGTIQANSSLFELQHLRYLDLSMNHFDSSSFPSEFGRLANLEHLDLSDNGFTGEVPFTISNLSRLNYLDLSYNKLTGEVPSSISNLSRLAFLNLSYNRLISRFFPIHNLTKLSFLDLSNNHFSGTIPSSLLTMPSLEFLALRQNQFREPHENMSYSTTSKLDYLDMAENLLSCRILEPISKFPKLAHLDLSFQNTTCTFNFDFLPFKSLEYLDLSGNSISMSNAKLTSLSTLILSNCNIAEFPTFIKDLRYLGKLDISKNRLTGEVPEWLWDSYLGTLDLSHNSFSILESSPKVFLNSSLWELDLSANAFQGFFPDMSSGIQTMAASNNNFSGSIPLTLCKPSNLAFLDLSNNHFNGSIPRCLDEGGSLEVVELSNNNLTGTLPHIKGLVLLDVGHNQISGKLPKSLVNSTYLKFLNVESNRITDTFPFWLKALPKLQVLVLRSNRFHGPISSPQNPLPFPALRIIDISHNKFYGSLPSNYFANWSSPLALVNIPQGNNQPGYSGDVHGPYSYLPSYYPSNYMRKKGLNTQFEKIQAAYTTIDFSGNRLVGQIPESIGLLKSLMVLDLSDNNFTGQIPSSLANLTLLESLDLSRNQLYGNIPQELTALTFLAYVNMSHNKLTGQIPKGSQIGGQPKSCFEGNLNLCGLPLEENCFKKNEAPLMPPNQEAEQEQVLHWKAAVIGYGPGVLFGVAIAHALATYKPMLFYKLFRL